MKKILKSIKKEYFLLLFIIISGAYLRIYHLGEESLWIDEGFTIIETQAISENFLPLLNSGEYLNHDFLLPYLLSPVGATSGNSIFWFRFVLAVFGILCIPLAYIIGKKLFENKTGIILAFMMAFSYWQIAWSRQIRAYILLEFLFLCVLFFLIKYHATSQRKFLVLIFGFSFLAVLDKIAAILILPSLLVYFLSKKDFQTSRWLSFFLLISTFPIIHYLQNDFSLTLNNYLAYYVVGYFWMYYGLIFALALCGFFVAIKRNPSLRSLHYFIITFFLSNLFLFSFLIQINQKRYLFILSSIIFIYAAYAISIFGEQKRKKALILATLIFFLLVTDALTTKNFSFTPRDNFPLEKYTPQPDFGSAYAYLGSVIRSDDYLISPYPYMDKIYLGKTFYALPISYTGRAGDTSMTPTGKEYYSGAPGILSIGKISSLRQLGDVYIILDTMALARANQKIVADITENFMPEASFLNHFSGDIIYIYRLPKII